VRLIGPSRTIIRLLLLLLLLLFLLRRLLVDNLITGRLRLT
jgi:hypothetical protein